MSRAFSLLEKDFSLVGAGGSLSFCSDTLTTVVNSTYLHWGIYSGEAVNLAYMSKDPSRRTSETVSVWNYANILEDIDTGTAVSYEEQLSKWALLVAASDRWVNYRHQADVLSVYQFLKKKGFDDDHIILIMADDIAENERNPYPGQVMSPSGENLYKGIHLDYKLTDLYPGDVSSILLGKKNERCHTVFDDANTSWKNADIFVFWSGHGSNIKGDSKNGKFEWAGKVSVDDMSFTTEMLRETLAKMKEASHYRKLLFFVETCYSGSVLSAAEGFDGVLAFTAANGTETSFADVYSYDLRTWLTNRFTMNFLGKLSESTDVTYYDLYRAIAGQTLGSHVQVINAARFGKLTVESAGEFF